MEDMGVEEDDARRTLKESRHLREMLCVDEGAILMKTTPTGSDLGREIRIN